MSFKNQVQLALWNDLMRNITYSEHLSVAMCNSASTGNPGALGLSETLRETNESTHTALEKLLNTFLVPNSGPRHSIALLANAHNIDAPSATVQSDDSLPTIVQMDDAPPANEQNDDAPPANVQNEVALPANVQNDDALPANAQNIVALPANAQNIVALPANAQNIVALPANAQNIVALPANAQNIVALPANAQNIVALPANIQNEGALPASNANSGNSPSTRRANAASRSQNRDANRESSGPPRRSNSYFLDHLPCMDLRRAMTLNNIRRDPRQHTGNNGRCSLPTFCLRNARARAAARNQLRPRGVQRTEPVNPSPATIANRAVSVPTNSDGQLVASYNGSNAELNANNAINVINATNTNNANNANSAPVIIQRGPIRSSEAPRNSSLIVLPEMTNHVRLTLDAARTINVYPIDNRRSANPRNSHGGDAPKP